MQTQSTDSVQSLLTEKTSVSNEFNYDNYEHITYDDPEFDALDPMTQFSVQMGHFIFGKDELSDFLYRNYHKDIVQQYYAEEFVAQPSDTHTAREYFLLAIAFYFTNNIDNAYEMLYQALQISPPITEQDMPISYGCGMYSYYRHDNSEDHIGPFIIFFMVEQFNETCTNALKIICDLTDAAKNQKKDIISDYLYRKEWQHRMYDLGRDIGDVYKKKQRKIIADDIQALNLHAYHIPDIIRSIKKSPSDYVFDEKYLTGIIYLLETTWIYTNSSYYKSGLFVDNMIFNCDKKIGHYDLHPAEIQVTTFGSHHLTQKITDILILVLDYFTTDEKLFTKSYDCLMRIINFNAQNTQDTQSGHVIITKKMICDQTFSSIFDFDIEVSLHFRCVPNHITQCLKREKKFLSYW